jgi:hypothetical protein
MTLPLLTVEDPTVQANFDLISQAIGQLQTADFVGTGDPNGAITASPPARYYNRAGGAGTTLYVKESGVATNTGWVGK